MLLMQEAVKVPESSIETQGNTLPPIHASDGTVDWRARAEMLLLDNQVQFYWSLTEPSCTAIASHAHFVRVISDE